MPEIMKEFYSCPNCGMAIAAPKSELQERRYTERELVSKIIEAMFTAFTQTTNYTLKRM